MSDIWPFLFGASYMWAGWTVVFALWQFEKIGEAINPLLPQAKRFKARFSLHPSIIISLLFFWPMVLPIWVMAEWHYRKN